MFGLIEQRGVVVFAVLEQQAGQFRELAVNLAPQSAW